MTTAVAQPLALRGGTPVRQAPFPSWPVFGPEDEVALLEVLHSGRWFLSDRVAEVERAFPEFHQARHGCAVSSGTTALQVALEAAGVGVGDEVVIPSYTFVATAAAVALVGAVPVFVDVTPDTYCIDVTAVEAAVTERTRAVIAVHLAGQPADLDGLTILCKKHGLRLIEDAAQAHCAEWKGRRVGAIGDLGTFSFQASKNLNAGEGGFVVSDDDALADAAWSIHNCGRSRSGEWYEHPLIGGNYRMTEFQAALLLSQMRNLEPQADLRSKNAALLADHLSDIEGIEPLLVDDRVTRHAYHLYVLRYDGAAFGGATRDRFIEALCAEGVPGAAGYRPLYREPAFQERFRDYPLDSPAFGGKPDYSQVDCPVTERICADEAVWLTQNLLLGSEQDIAHIAEAVRKIQQSSDQLAG
ncbi:MAG TPA: DegT/DnrJ/EryC1/StrS family aminotransferase [Candidatus Latescibacteria bacterium]|nr:DegT/DnrJ/EryC1/StrS family aminotransferase [Candidatus Latescibacterota bacterium]